jgi:prepilin-type N-terminal cleavage/methylation domain-containing protein
LQTKNYCYTLEVIKNNKIKIMKQQMKKGFTLIELLVVIAIIGILSAIVIVNLNSARNKAQDTAIKAQASQLKNTAAVYYDDNGYGYSTSAVASVIAIQACPTSTGSAGSFASTFFSNAEAVAALNGMAKNAGRAVKCAMGSGNPNSQSWVVTSAQRNSTKFWCVDSSGSAREVAAETTIAGSTANEVMCPAS